jgi:hypothetical protein
LSISGYLGIALNTTGNPIDEYRGIWLVGIAGCILTAAIGVGIAYLVNVRAYAELKAANSKSVLS